MRQEYRERLLEEAQTTCRRIVSNVNQVIIGKEKEVELAVIALACQGHLLVEDIPGVGKTTLTKSLARSVGCSFKRIQFTPDLLPSDILGVTIYNQKTGDFEFHPGPIMAQVVLADEINRASPKTQSALLECMEERQITVDGTTHTLPRPFWVMATLNPVEPQGTFALPLAQMDRFLLRLSLGYPGFEDEVSLIEKQRQVHPLETLGQVVEAAQLLALYDLVKLVQVDVKVREYIVSIVEASRQHPLVQLGASPRASLALARSAQAFALLHGRDYVLPDDIKELAGPAIAHRLFLSHSAHMKEVSTTDIVAEVVAAVPVPGARPHIRGTPASSS